MCCVVPSDDLKFLMPAVHINHPTLSVRIPETKKNTDGQITKQVHSGKNNGTSEQLRKTNLNGPLSSPQVTKVWDMMAERSIV